MHQERENLDILFRRTAPETVLENIRLYGRFFKKYALQADAQSYDYNTYEHYAALNLPEYSPDETELRFNLLQEFMQKDKDAMIFYPLCAYAEKVLAVKNNTPVCKMESILGWNSISKRLGQDIFVTAWMAWKDCENYNTYTGKFTWSAVIGTDDCRLESIFEKGLAENHFHLHGSTQSFALSWACMMNHPESLKIKLGKDSNFAENLNVNVSKGVLDHQMEWSEKIAYAAMIRGLLFARCAGIKDSREVWNEFKKFDRLPLISVVKRQTEALRIEYGERFEQLDKKRRCLDYANSRHCYQIDEDAQNRLLAGERSFLYHCFRMQFHSQLTLQESSLFYLYLLIKSNFRSELIQVNKRTGFTNFANYQDRKNQFFADLEEYRTESQRLSVGAAMGENHVVSLEARIMPRETAEKMRREIKDLDKRIELALGNRDNMPYYVIHFPKKKFSLNELKNKEYMLLPRNWKIREGTKRKAKALVKYLQCYDAGTPRVYGIDACSLEIGCRPEVFATEFRYVRRYGISRRGVYWVGTEEKRQDEIGITYHVGEDFLDIPDGLRAIDEAMAFLQMKKGDRLGHAIALGIEPLGYYLQKRRNIYLPKQDYLDNIIWILYRSLELNIEIDINHRVKMQEEARRLLSEIYYSHEKEMMNRQPMEMLDMYYDSWKLRGDHPDLYRTGVYVKEKMFVTMPYNSCMENGDFALNYRNNEIISHLYYLYHFSPEVKKRGMQAVAFGVEDWYIDLVREFQKALRMEVAKKGISIECNPTSNVLIGTFQKYDRHPILAFNNYRLEDDGENVHIPVSVNTDDIGVFDTSLENEYALLLCAICRTRHKEGNYNDDTVYEYLDYLRENGLRMSFKKINKPVPIDADRTRLSVFDGSSMML